MGNRTLYGRSPKVGTPNSLNPIRVMYREFQHYLALIRFPTSWSLLYQGFQVGRLLELGGHLIKGYEMGREILSPTILYGIGFGGWRPIIQKPE